MNELSPEARRILGLARRGDELKDADRARLDHRVARRLALAAGVTGTALGTAKVATGTAILSTMLGKGLITGTLVVAAVAGGWKATEHYVSQERAVPGVAVSVVPTSNLTPKQPNMTGQLVAQPIETEQLVAQPMLRLDEAVVTAPAAPRRDDGAVTASSVPRDVAATNQPQKIRSRADTKVQSGADDAEPASDGPTDPLLAEVAALREAQKAMSAGQPEQTLGLITEQDKRFAGGALAQERAAAKIFALCNLGRVAEARVGAAAFDRRWPRSPLISRVRRACGSDAIER